MITLLITALQKNSNFGYSLALVQGDKLRWHGGKIKRAEHCNMFHKAQMGINSDLMVPLTLYLSAMHT